jgi:hypothetical protein
VVDVPLPDNAYLLKEIEDVEIATFTDGSPLPMPKLEVAIEPQQDLHGYDSPWVGGSGKNKWSKGDISGTLLEEISGMNIPVGTWTLSANVTSSDTDSTKCFIYDMTPGYQNAIANIARGNRQSVTFTTDHVITDMRFYASTSYSSSSGDTFSFTDIQIESGSTATSFAPYSNICPISGWTACNVTRSGVNVWDEEWENRNIDDGTINLKFIASKNFIPVVPNTQYYIKWIAANYGSNALIYFYDTNKNQIGSPLYKTQSSAFSTGDARYIKFNIWRNNVVEPYNNDISINYPSTDTEYHAYNPNSETITIQLGDTYYGGKLDVVSGVLTVDRALIKLNDLNWTKQNTTSGNWRFISSQSIQNVKLPTDASWKIDNLCSVYQNATANETWTAEKTGIAINADGKLIICDLNQANTTALGVVIANQTYCYKLATPIEVQLTPTQVNSLMGVNNIWANCGKIIDGQYFSKGE